ncbi:MAG: LysM peptidoglycan-binding domain-containing protein, partial [Anaerolineae bacterium]|nr:LysM peptidoglycan-binding domain-containing protein [Anaerolineae bacterium]
SGIPPTLAPLGADTTQLTEGVEATTVSGDPTATTSALGEGDTVDSSGATQSPTSQAIDLSGESSVTTGDQGEPTVVEEAAIQPETFTPPTNAEEASAVEPIIVDATTGSELPAGGPIAVNPPASETTGDYALAPAAPVPTGGFEYVVDPGDTLFGISLAYGTSVQAIMAANGLTSETIYFGQTLTIPGGGSGYNAPAFAPTYPGSSGDYLVSPGDTLFNIALRFGSSVEAIAIANGIPAPYIIYAGQTLVIPAYAADSSVPTGTGFGSHTVAPGETLYLIAQRYGVSTQALVAANGLFNPNQIQAGQVLIIP